MVASITLRQRGRLNMSDAGNHWKPFSAVQRVVAHRAGFDWDARVLIAPGLPVRVHDAYVAGVGQLRAAVQGLFKVADTTPLAALSEAELMRFLAEGVWYPTALLPSQGVVWAAVDAHSATATLHDSGHCVSLLFHFQADGLVDSVHADARAPGRWFYQCRTLARPLLAPRRSHRHDRSAGCRGCLAPAGR